MTVLLLILSRLTYAPTFRLCGCLCQGGMTGTRPVLNLEGDLLCLRHGFPPHDQCPCARLTCRRLASESCRACSDNPFRLQLIFTAPRRKLDTIAGVRGGMYPRGVSCSLNWPRRI